MTSHQLSLLTQGNTPDGAQPDESALTTIAAAFDPARLIQARRLAGLTKKVVADEIGVSPSAVGQWEAGAPSPVPITLPAWQTYSRSPQPFSPPAAGMYVSTSATRISAACAPPGCLTGQGDRLHRADVGTHPCTRNPRSDPPGRPSGFTGGEVHPGDYTGNPAAAAAALRRHWGLGEGPIPTW